MVWVCFNGRLGLISSRAMVLYVGLVCECVGGVCGKELCVCCRAYNFNGIWWLCL